MDKFQEVSNFMKKSILLEIWI